MPFKIENLIKKLICCSSSKQKYDVKTDFINLQTFPTYLMKGKLEKTNTLPPALKYFTTTRCW